MSAPAILLHPSIFDLVEVFRPEVLAGLENEDAVAPLTGEGGGCGGPTSAGADNDGLVGVHGTDSSHSKVAV